ncbi:MAG TPA: carboxypeptidase-like regulatory domain-containing protein [Pyrinomonadaceae bacterium]|nr:carboxypeptidase-like regulatory domain-containing protein [Pyrinomonadaceae bacterium]
MKHSNARKGLSCILCLLLSFVHLSTIKSNAQDTVTGAFEGTVTNSETGAIITGASVEIINQQTNQTTPKTSDSRGRFYAGLLAPGIYLIRVSAQGFQTKEVRQRLFITRTGEVVPVPVALDPAPPVAATATSPTPAPPPLTEEETDIRARINASDARQGGAFTEEEVSTLPLGSSTFTRTFDELTLLLPGVAPPPQTLGSVAGPGVGAGVGSAGQFSVNGLRSRANNFTVDGSDNNDEDIGVRRQGFVALIPQPIESVKEYQAITLLAPAQFGRNIGAQVNAVSKSGGSEHHGTLYGFLNSSQLNARNAFDTANGNARTPLFAGNNQPVLLGVIGRTGTVVSPASPVTVLNQSGGEDSFTFGQGGFVLGGPIVPRRAFYFVSAEGYVINATSEESFAVPTVEQRGAFGTGATGIFRDPFGRRAANGSLLDPTLGFPTTSGGDAIFSLFPFPNNPQGVYGANTFTQVLPADGEGKILSGKFDANFKALGRQHSLTNRYNFTDDERVIPSTGGALFSSLRPRVRTQNNSFFFNSELSGANSTRPLFNQLRLSYGRTRLNFAEERDQTFERAASLVNEPFLLNAPLLENFTLPEFPNVNGQFQIRANTGPVFYFTTQGRTVEDLLGVVGQVSIAGFSPIGIDVFNFPQRRVNNTYQVADELTMRAGGHSFVFGTDIRRSELNSELPRNSRPLITFGGAPRLTFDFDSQNRRFTNFAFTGEFIRPETLAAASAPSGFSQTLAVNGEAAIGLRFYQLNFYAQDTWRVRPALSLSYGLRYEYNTPPREVNRRIEDTFNDPALDLIPGLRQFIGDRTSIFKPDRNNFAPRIGIAYAPNLFGRERGLTVIRAGYGLFYDQILGAVVSQSRNVYPSYLTVDLAAGFSNAGIFERLLGIPDPCPNRNCPLEFRNPNLTTLNFSPIVRNGTLNTLVPGVPFAQLVNAINQFGTGGGLVPAVNGFGFTIPEQELKTPLAHQYTVSVEQQLGRNFVASVSYVGTSGRNLLRFTTPNLGRNAFVAPRFFSGGRVSPAGFPEIDTPAFFGFVLPPGTRIASDGSGFTGGRPVSGIGTVNRFETTASSRYDSLQLQMRGRFRHALQLNAAYTFSRTLDDVSDVFDLAGASALPQNSFDFAAERGRANFDAPHRFAYHAIYDLPDFKNENGALRLLLGGLQIASKGSYRSGQPFTVNSIYDVNLDGNLTDRPDTTAGIIATGDRRQPLRLATDNPNALLAPIGQDGRVGRNTFRAGNVLELDMAVVKNLRFGESQNVTLRMDIFNFINRANYGVPVRFLEAPGFGRATNTVTPGRRIQFALKYSF